MLVTGHTGFKRSWIREWLCLMGANVVGYSLPPDPAVDLCLTTPYACFDELGLPEGRICDTLYREQLVRFEGEPCPTGVGNIN